MAPPLNRLWKLEFEGRIFVSFTIAAAASAVCFLGFPDLPSALVLLGGALGLSSPTTLRGGYCALAACFALLSVARMWAGSLLTPERVMAFEVQTDLFATSGPYRLTRNPIYWVDLSALTLLGACMPWPGLAMPVLFYLHYLSIIRYEEDFLSRRHGPAYQRFLREVPRLLPTPRSCLSFARSLGELRVSRAGFRHNALWVLFVPGMVASAVTLRLSTGVLVGLVSVIDWAVVHTVIGVRKRPEGALPEEVSKP